MMAVALVIQPYQSRPDTSKIFRRFTVFLTSGNIFQDIPYPVSQYVDEENEPNQARRFFGHEIKRCGYLKMFH